jgi:RimJ/RimL family protein N-acetyltransferase
MRLEAQDVVLRPYQGTDHHTLVAILGDVEVMKQALEERALCPEEANKFIKEHFDTTADSPPKLGTLCLRSTGEVIGFAGYMPCKYLGVDDLEFGFVISRIHQGKGYATQIGRELIAFALTTLGYHRVLALCNPSNEASKAVLAGEKKLALTFEKKIDVPKRGERNVYVATRGNLHSWTATRAKPEGKGLPPEEVPPEEVPPKRFQSIRQEA